MTRRRGMSLIEVVILIGATATMLGLCVGLIGSLMKLDRAGRADLAAIETLDRLARQLRADVHAASVADAAEDGSRLTLRRPGGEPVDYRAEGEGARLVRIAPGEGEGRHQETFRLPRGDRVRLSVREEGGRPFVRAAVARDGPAARELAILAALGWDHRFGEGKADDRWSVT